MQIIKYGGNCLNKIENRKQILFKIKQMEEPLILVVSAFKEGPYSTTTLEGLMQHQYTYLMKQQLMVLGEIISSTIFTNECLNEGIDATLIYPYEIGIYVKSSQKMEDIEEIDGEAIENQLDHHKVVIVPGFIGINQDNFLVTLNKGGSDLTAILLACMFHQTEVTLKKDVMGLASIDPKLSSNFKLYPVVSYDMLLLIMEHGSNLLQKEALLYAKDHKIEIHISSFLNDTYQTIVRPLSQEKVVVFQLKEGILFIDGYNDSLKVEQYLKEEKIPFDYLLALQNSLKIITGYDNAKSILLTLHEAYLKGKLG